MLNLRVIIAGGGTGGHLFPGIAIARGFLACNPKTIVRFVGTDRPFEKRILKQEGFKHTALKIEGIKGRGLMRQLLAFCMLPGGLWQTFSLLIRFRPQLVVGVGGYSAFPVVFGAWLLGIKRVLHEQNISAGLTNRFLAFLANRIYVSFENTRRLPACRKKIVTGNPVRGEILQVAAKTKNPKKSNVKKNHLNLLVLGGSQGAHRINIAMTEAAKIWPGLKQVELVHQTGVADCDMVQKAYKTAGVAATVAEFFTDMAKQYQYADLIICRAGATTVAEISAIGKAAVFIPFPFAADDHQTGNAQALVAAGAACMMAEKDLDGLKLSAKLSFLLKNPAALNRMADAARGFGRPAAADLIVEDCYKLLKLASPDSENRSADLAA
jgi:UDP-N-acetylglucosamine--N-acetylmuramyl-(pentapeptide) pyrophosphoryl-undecaprenol N-acetylglucosamine transferase